MSHPPVWNPAVNLAYTYKFINERLLRRTPTIFEQMYNSIHGLADDGQTGSCASELLVDSFEHVYCAPTDDLRIAHLRKHAGPKILDFGCGNGFFAIHLAIAGADVTCIESNPVKREYLSWLADQLGIHRRIHFETSQQYDSVVCLNVLDHLPNAPEAVTELASVLRTGGALFLYAHFTEDGVHVSDVITISKTFAALVDHFERALPEVQSGPWMEHWIRQPHEKHSDDVRARYWIPQDLDDISFRRLRPLVHPDAQLHLQEEGNSVLVEGDRFYLRPMSVERGVVDILALCDGSLSVYELCDVLVDKNLTEDEVIHTLRTLCRERFVSFLAPQF